MSGVKGGGRGGEGGEWSEGRGRGEWSGGLSEGRTALRTFRYPRGLGMPGIDMGNR